MDNHCEELMRKFVERFHSLPSDEKLSDDGNWWAEFEKVQKEAEFSAQKAKEAFLSGALAQAYKRTGGLSQVVSNLTDEIVRLEHKGRDLTAENNRLGLLAKALQEEKNRLKGGKNRLSKQAKSQGKLLDERRGIIGDLRQSLSEIAEIVDGVELGSDQKILADCLVEVMSVLINAGIPVGPYEAEPVVSKVMKVEGLSNGASFTTFSGLRKEKIEEE